MADHLFSAEKHRNHRDRLGFSCRCAQTLYFLAWPDAWVHV